MALACIINVFIPNWEKKVSIRVTMRTIRRSPGIPLITDRSGVEGEAKGSYHAPAEEPAWPPPRE